MTTWRALAHGPLLEIDPGLWMVRGSVPGMEMTRNMVVARRSDGALAIHSPVALEERAMSGLEALGAPAFLLPPNRFHRMDIGAFAARYPAAKVLCPAGARKAVAQRSRVDGTYEAYPQDPSVAVVPGFAGTKDREGALIVRSGGRASLVVADAMMNMPHGKGLAGFFFRHVTDSTGGPKVSRLFALVTISDRRAFAAHLRRLADTPGLVRILVAHGDPIDDDPAGFLRREADRLAGRN